MLTVVNEADARQAFRDSIGSFVDCYRDLEEPDSFAPVPAQLATRIHDLAVRLVCVAFFPTAPSQFIAHATALLEQSAGSPWLTDAPGSTSEEPWVRALLLAFTLPHQHTDDPRASRSPSTARLLLNKDGTLRDATEAVQLICLNVHIHAADAPEIFARLGAIKAPRDLTNDEQRHQRRAVGVVRELQRDGIVPDGATRAGPTRVTRRRAAFNFAEALGLKMERRPSRRRARS